MDNVNWIFIQFLFKRKNRTSNTESHASWKRKVKTRRDQLCSYQKNYYNVDSIFKNHL